MTGDLRLVEAYHVKKVESPSAPWLDDAELDQILQFLRGHPQYCAGLFQFELDYPHRLSPRYTI